ncbi:hypothetical protein GOA57_05200 [Sinorhizobium meliloti]|nr:hypothetical protein [Sinorhizobium meliloti]
MRNGKLRAVALALMLLPSIADAGNIKIRGAGTASCGTWISEPELRQSLLIQWVLGYITAMNYGRWNDIPLQPEEIDLLKGADVNAIEVWMSNYCTQNPLEPLWVAAGVLVEQGSK